MATNNYDITSLFQAGNGATIKRKDSAVSDAVDQLNKFAFTDSTKTSMSHLQPTTITFTPSTGSTCLSLYPRTRTFTYNTSLTSNSCTATCDQGKTWRISALPESRFTIERVEGDNVREAYRRCSVVVVSAMPGIGGERRGTSVDGGRKLSVGCFSSGFGGGAVLPFAGRV